MLEFQRFIGILFTSHQLLDGKDIKRLEVKQILRDVPVESRFFHQCYNQPFGKLVVKGIVAFKVTILIGARVGTNLS